MANIVVTSTANTIKIVTNDYSDVIGIEAGVWAKSDIYAMKLFSDHIEIDTFEKENWNVSNVNTTYLQIDTVDGIAPTSLSDLYNKLTALIV